MKKATANARVSTIISFLGLEELSQWWCSREVPKDSLSWTRFSGPLAVVLILLLFLSGTFMAFYYTPMPGTAYDSVDFALFNLPFGSVIKGVHHYSWNLLLIVAGLHLCRTFITGSYKAPRQLVWVTGLLILLFVPLFIITGDLLPWDQKGYWSTQVRLSILSSVPVIGEPASRLLLGGSMIGVVALTRFYILHILVLPGLLVLLCAAHFHFIYHRGLLSFFKRGAALQPKIPIYPDLVNRWLFLFIMAALVLGWSGWFWTPPLGDPADPTDSSYIPKPEWWVLFLNQLVSIFKGRQAILGSTVIPAMLTGFLMVLPFIDNAPPGRAGSRWKIFLPATLIAIGILGLSVMGYLEHNVTSGPGVL